MRRRLLLLLSGSSVLSAAAPALAQTTPRTAKVAIKGYDTVAYFTAGKPTKGNPSISEVWDGTRYLFSSEENRKLFAANPDKYAPQFSGYCAASLAHGVKLEAEPENFIISDGRLYLFARPVPPDMLAKQPDLVARAKGNIALLK
jgi:YHS domain-containing protein